MKNLFILYVVLLNFELCSQIYEPLVFPKNVSQKYIFNSIEEYSKLKRETDPKGKLDLDEYYYENVISKCDFFSGGEVYMDWDSLENYLNLVLNKILPSNLSSKNIRAYVGRSTEANAFCLYDGTMIVNIGLLAEIKSEAALAHIMSHELGHFIKGHSLKRFNFKQAIEQQQEKNGLKKDLDIMSFYQDCESEADYVGLGLLSDAGYDIREALSNLELFIEQKEHFEKSNNSVLVNEDTVIVNTEEGRYRLNTLEKLLSTHPDLTERYDIIVTFINITKQNKTDQYKIDEDFFHRMKAMARLESTMLEFNDHNYKECLERSFFYYLFEPDEITYSYLITESTRRLCLLNNELRKKGFLTEKLGFNGFKEKEGILHDLRYICPDSIAFSGINALNMLKSEPYAFETYEEAFYYFNNELIKKNNPEAFLSRALFENNKEVIANNIDKYLSYQNVKYRAFALSYKNGTHTDQVINNNKEYIMIPKVGFYYHSDYSRFSPYVFGYTKTYYKKTETSGVKLANKLVKYFNSNNHNIKAVSVPYLNLEDFNFKHKYLRAFKATFLSRKDENSGKRAVHMYEHFDNNYNDDQVDVFRLDPETWNFFMDEKISTITYLNFTRHESRFQRRLKILYTLCIIPSLGIFSIFAAGTVVNYKQANMISYSSKYGEVFKSQKAKIYKLRSGNAYHLFKRLSGRRENQIKRYLNGLHVN